MISVVIPAHNAEATLAQCLDSVLRNTGVTFEILVVNDASTDRTEAIALQRPCTVITTAHNLWAAHCRNIGASHARGDTLIFFDADQSMPADTLQQYDAALQSDSTLHAVVASLADDTPCEGFFSKFKNFQHHFVHQTARREGTTLASGLMAIRRNTFFACGGFEPPLGPASVEDIALGYTMTKLGYRIEFFPAIQVIHHKSYSLISMIRSDVLHRAIPWTRLMLRDRYWRLDLNTRGSNIASVTLSWLMAAVALLQPAQAVVVGTVLGLAVGTLNSALLRAAYRRFGIRFAVRALVFLPLMYFYHGVGFLLGLSSYFLRMLGLCLHRAFPARHSCRRQ